MAKLTLLEIVQDIANDLDTDSINSINDTVEADQIAQIVKTCYFELMANRNWPHLRRTTQLDNSVDVDHPTSLKLPVGTREISNVMYNMSRPGDLDRLRYQPLTYLYPDEFLAMLNSRNSELESVVEFSDFGGISLLLRKDKNPEYYTSFDDEYIVCDSYDIDKESTLTGNNTQALVYFEPTWQMVDTFVPDIPSDVFPLLIEEAKSTASLALRQESNQKAEQKAVRQQRWLSRKAWRVEGGVRYPNYGRS